MLLSARFRADMRAAGFHPEGWSTWVRGTAGGVDHVFAFERLMYHGSLSVKVSAAVRHRWAQRALGYIFEALSWRRPGTLYLFGTGLGITEPGRVTWTDEIPRIGPRLSPNNASRIMAPLATASDLRAFYCTASRAWRLISTEETILRVIVAEMDHFRYGGPSPRPEEWLDLESELRPPLRPLLARYLTGISLEDMRVLIRSAVQATA